MTFKKFLNLDYKWHLSIATLVRAILVVYGSYHDQVSSVPYTDVDYSVFTDASRHILNNESPFNRHTYRYSPLIAFLLIPNVTWHIAFGKILFCFVDILVALLLRTLIKYILEEYDKNKTNDDKVEQTKLKIRHRKKSKHALKTSVKSTHDQQADIGMMLWLYNPITIAIATRGNCDSIAGLLVLLTMYFVQCKKKYFIAGLMHGIAIHIRLYPICYSLTLFMHLSNFAYYTTNRFRSASKAIQKNHNDKKTIFKRRYMQYIIPNINQLQLVFGCLLSLSALTYLFYYKYGYQFLYETYIYHLIRKDTRHNFSIYFYLQYLTAGVSNIGLWQKVLSLLPQLILLIVFSIRYGLNKFALNFGILVQTVTIVTYNSVLTSQYFVWILVVLPLSTCHIKMSRKMTVFLLVIWFIAQLAWLFPAYLLEFRGKNTFLFIWLQSVSFFCANIAILGRLIMKYMPVKKHVD